MNFMEAYAAHKKGKDVQRKDVLHGGYIHIERATNGKYHWYSEADIEATDWEIKLEPMKFLEAMKHFQEGKRVANTLHGSSYYHRQDVCLCLPRDEIDTDTWYIVDENDKGETQ